MTVRDELNEYRVATTPNEMSDAELQGMVERIVREELQQLVSGVERLGHTPASSDILTVMQWLAPFMRETIVDALRLGLSFQTTVGLQALPSGEANSGTTRGFPEVSDFNAALQAARARDQERSPAVDRAANDDGSNDDAEISEDATDAAGTALLSGHVTLLVSPFEGFADVQRFLLDMARIPRVFDVKPKRFTGGRLYVTFGTEYGDTQALADVLSTELAAYRPVLRSVQSDFLELLLRPEV